MTRPSNGNLSHDDHRRIARLMQLHKQTHPERIAERYKISPEYVRRIWTDLPLTEQAPLSDALGALP